MTARDRPSRGHLALVLLRATATVVLLVTLYYTLPLTRRPSAATAALLVGGLAVLAALLTWQIRAIARSHRPGLRALETLALAIPAFLLLFAAGYYLESEADTASFTEHLTRTDALYFTITVLSTVGFGDITPVAPGTRIAVTVQMVADLLLLGFVLRAVLGAVERARGRRDDSPGGAP